MDNTEPALPKPRQELSRNGTYKWYSKTVASGVGGTITIEDNSDAYLFDIAQSLRRIANTLELTRTKAT